MPQPQEWRKSLIQFQPSALAPVEQSERHYLQVHSPWALREIRAMDDMLAYHTNLVLGQWDLTGGFHRAPDLWRFATMRTRPGGQKGFPGPVLAFLSEDHENFARELRGFQVRETTWFDRRSGQLSADKYVVVLDLPENTEREVGEAAVDRVEQGLASLLDDAYGARLMSSNRVLSESVYTDRREPRQGITGRVTDSDRLAYLELWFDHQAWGEEFFAQPRVLELLVDGGFAPGASAAYHVLERIGHDKR